MSSTSPDPTERFSNRADAYQRYRPGYPDTLLETLRTVAHLSDESVIADIGSGTGISTELFLRRGFEVYAVEPNEAMRAAAEGRLGRNGRFHSVPGTAEATTLPSGSADLITAGQAFHWFDANRAQREFARILRPAGFVALFWNSRETDATPFLRAYEDLLETYGTDYGRVNHRKMGHERLEALLSGGYDYFSFPNEQVFDYDGLEGRLRSSSYTPAPEHPRSAPMINQLRKIFDAYQEGGTVRFIYTTELHVGRL